MDTRAIQLLAVLAMVSVSATVTAHPVATERLEIFDQRIAADPANAELYLERGRIRHHEDAWDSALADYRRAAELGIDPDVADLARGELLQQAGRHAEAGGFLDRLLARRPDHLRALVARARARSALGLTEASADDYLRALDLAARPSPDLYLETVRTLARAGRDDEALRRADEGLECLGPLSVLASLAIEIEVARGHYEPALALLERTLTTSSFVEKWLLRRAEILELAGRLEEAHAAYRAALDALERRPAKRRSTRALTELEGRIHDGLRRLPASGRAENCG